MIHKFYEVGHYMVLDVYSGAVHVVDKLCYELLDLLTPPFADECPPVALDYSKEEIAEAYTELLALYNAGQLFSEDDYSDAAKGMVLSPVKSMCLNVSHDCNLRCTYCFAGKGDYGARMTMSPDVGRKAIDFLIAHSDGRENLEVDFFGGEPLLNFGTVREVVDYAKAQGQLHDKRFRFTITTNGLLLDDEKIEYINREMSNVVLSIDGRKEVHDLVRSRVDGSGCYDAVLPKFQKLVASRTGEYYVRGTFTKHNLDFSDDVMHLAAMGFDQVSVEPVVAAPDADYALTPDDLPRIYEEYARLAKRLLDVRKSGDFVNFFHFMLDLDQGPCAIKRLRGCGCGNEYVAITPEGDIYPCHQFIGHEQWKMGSLEDGSFDDGMKTLFAAATVYSKPECVKCWAKFYCSGGCDANNMQYAGDIHTPVKLSCDMEKRRLQCALAMIASENARESTH